MEAFSQQLANWELEGLSDRQAAAQIDAQSGGVCGRRVPEDTHYLGDAQWSYCREMAKYAHLVTSVDGDEDGDAKKVVNYIYTNKVSCNDPSHCSIRLN